MGDTDRLLELPSLIGREFRLSGIGWRESAADIVLSSIGMRICFTLYLDIPIMYSLEINNKILTFGDQ